MAKRIQSASSEIGWVERAHAVEHSLEIQLPFLQIVLGNFEIVPILMGQQDYDTCLKLSDALVRTLRGEKDTLLLASTDLSHFHPYEKAKALDGRFQQHIGQLDAPGLWEDLRGGSCEACGGGAVIAVLTAATRLGVDRSVILRYANSGDVTGDHSRVVGYLAAVLLSEH
jgi:AmmeMemoRadiSam system protein B